MLNNSFPHDAFSQELAANSEYIKAFKYSGLTGVAQKGLAIVTCMDSRINPLSIMGMNLEMQKFCAMQEHVLPKTFCENISFSNLFARC
jgi:hypothetical protein